MDQKTLQVNQLIRVLGVEDNEIQRNLLKVTFEVLYDVFHLATASDLQTALDMLATGNYDVLLLDLCLPKNSKNKSWCGGADTVRLVRQAYPHIPIVVMTSGDPLNDNLEHECMEAGASGVLFKLNYSVKLLVTELTLAVGLERKRMEQRSDQIQDVYRLQIDVEVMRLEEVEQMLLAVQERYGFVKK